MTRLKVTVDKQEDLLELQALLTRMGLKFWINENDDMTDVSEIENTPKTTAIKDE